MPRARSLAGIASVVASLLASLAALPCARAQEVPVRPAEISVSATGESRVVPDRVVVTLGVESRAPSAAAAARANAAAQRAVLDTLRKMGLRDDQLTTANFNVRPDYDVSREGRASPRVTGYVVSNTVQATLEDVAR
ncbi:MAG TPA: SIMPL domain-containing protein, partial [Gemmatimonadales bacterium]